MDHTFSNTCRWVQDKEFIKKYVEKIQDAKNNLDTLFDELKEQIEKDLCTVTKENVIEESTANISKYQRWIDRLYQVQTKVNKVLKRRFNV
jgi:RNAse (barnase) inhibitor barstar